MSLVIATNTLIDVLETLTATAGKESTNEGVFLFSTRGAFGEEPGETDLLAGLSTNGEVSAHYYAPAEGGTLEPTFWPAGVASMVSSVFAERAAEVDDHALRVSQGVDGRVEILEYDDPAVGRGISFNALEADDFPHAGVVRLLTRTSPSQTNVRVAADDMEILDSGAELWDSASMGLALRVAKKKKAKLVVEKTVTNGAAMLAFEGVDNWEGVVAPPTPKEAATLAGVFVETHLDFTPPTPVAASA